MSNRAKRIQDKTSIERVLYDLGYPVMSGSGREFQFPCDLHGDGNDGKFSARVYPDSSSWYCFACGKSRDAIETYRDKFGLEFGKACETLERKYGLPVYQYKRKEEVEVPVDTSEQDFELLSKRVAALLSYLAKDKDMPTTLSWWEAYDCICWYVSEGKWDHKKGCGGLERIFKGIKKR